MMTKLREMSWVFLWVIIFSFLGLMVFEWGASYTGLRKAPYVGEIDGRKIKLEDYDRQLAELREQYRQNNVEMDESMSKRTHQELWERMIQQTLLNKFIQQYDIKTSPEEVAYYVLNNPHPQLLNNPQLQTNGQFDINKYQMVVQNDKNLQTQLYNYYSASLPAQKLESIISEGFKITDAEVFDEYLKTNLGVKLQYLLIQRSKFGDEIGTVSDNDLLAYYNSHKQEFKGNDQAVLEYVTFNVVPDQQDSMKVMDDARSIIARLKKGESFETLADEFSDDPNVKQNHGDLGFMAQPTLSKQLQKPAFEAKLNSIVGPIVSKSGIHILQVLKQKKFKDERSGQWITKRHIKHILLRVQPSAEISDIVREKADNFVTDAEKNSFEEAATRMKAKINITQPFIRGSFVPAVGSLKAANDFAFNEDPGTISPVMYYKATSNSNPVYYVFRVKERIKEEFKPFDKVKMIVETKVRNQKRDALLQKYMDKVKKAVAESNSLEEAASKLDKKYIRFGETNKFKAADIIEGLGRVEELYLAGIKLAEIGKIYGPVDNTRGIFYINVLEKDSVDMEAFNVQKSVIRSRLEARKGSLAFMNWWNKQKNTLDVKDYRYKYYRDL